MESDPFEVPTAIADMMRQRLEDQAEIARLRAALERIAASECALAWVCARDALDGAALAPQKTEET